ncbi:uncharacterized protein [Leptinotarsa decemlineata]|uniref:uncharacterized protein n=1 Tax=Leptinotarsa decemlineata TaxID=7539 RepID=UPI003D30BC97
MAAFALVTTDNGMQTVIPRSEIISQDNKVECFILGKRYKIVINGFNEDFLSLYNFAVGHNTRRLKVVLEKNLNIDNPNKAKLETPKGRKKTKRITDSLEGRSVQKKMKPRRIFQNVPIEVECVEGISRIHHSSFISSTVSPILFKSNDLPSVCNCLSAVCNCLSSASDSLSPMHESLPPMPDSLPPTIESLAPSIDCSLPKVDCSLPSVDCPPPTNDRSPPTIDSLPATNNIFLSTSFNSLPSKAMGLPSSSSSQSSISILSTIAEESVSEMIDDNPTLVNEAAYKRRICNKPNICKFCKQSKTNVKRHILSMHRNEPEVKEYIAMADENPNKKEKLSQIRRDGNFSAFKEGENIVPARVSKYFDKPDKSQYIACTCCKIIVKKDSLRKHLQKNCRKNPSNSSKGMLFKSRANSENIHRRANEVVKYFLFPAFRDGPIKEIIRFDNLIILYGNEMACKYRSQHHYPMIRNRMIRMARVLSMIKEKNSSVRHFEDILKPQMFDYIIEVINTLGDYDENTGNYNKPSLPTEVGTSLKYMIQLHISECIKNGDMEGKKDSKNLLHLLKTALPAHVNKTASESLLKHKRKKLSILPSMGDIKKLNSYVMTKRNHYYEALMKSSM